MKTTHNNRTELPQERMDELFKILRTRFEKNKNRHKELDWSDIQTRLESSPDKLWSLNEMEETGGEPDVIEYDKKTILYSSKYRMR